MTIMQDLESGACFRFPGGSAIFQVVEPGASFRGLNSQKVYYQVRPPEPVISESWMQRLAK